MFCLTVKAVEVAFSAVPVAVFPLYAGHFPRITPPRTVPLGIFAALDCFFFQLRVHLHEIHAAVIIPRQIVEESFHHFPDNHHITPLRNRIVNEICRGFRALPKISNLDVQIQCLLFQLRIFLSILFS